MMKDLAADAVERKAEKEKRKMKKKMKKRVKKVCRGILWTAFVLCLGIFIGIHRRVIKAWLTGSEMPAAPEGHCHPACGKCMSAAKKAASKIKEVRAAR